MIMAAAAFGEGFEFLAIVDDVINVRPGDLMTRHIGQIQINLLQVRFGQRIEGDSVFHFRSDLPARWPSMKD